MANEKEQRRQFVSFRFYRLLPEWRRLDATVRREYGREFADTVRKWSSPDQMRILTYSLMGMRADCDFMLWRFCYSLDCLNTMSAELMRTGMAGYIEPAYSMLGATRHSQYAMDEEDDTAPIHGALRRGVSHFLMIYPLERTHSWYLLPFEERRRMIREITELYSEFQSHVNVFYSFGLDDPDFIIAVEIDNALENIERVMRLHEADASQYIQKDRPILTCLHQPIDKLIESLGA